MKVLFYELEHNNETVAWLIKSYIFKNNKKYLPLLLFMEM